MDPEGISNGSTTQVRNARIASSMIAKATTNSMTPESQPCLLPFSPPGCTAASTDSAGAFSSSELEVVMSLTNRTSLSHIVGVPSEQTREG